ncbi:DUF642 domain-containing protein [Tundrisphaera sp. TA3]|uniref:DUF642 domain-containing protein n=1 Tax=Tundrisphaera sp. TA3 TaxID=3435775 RepID=UPI003EBA7876
MRFFSRPGAAGRGFGARRRADRSLRPSLNDLERRDLLAAGALGINAAPEYVDLMKGVRDWEPIPDWMDYWNSPDVVTRDDEGWPTSDGGVVVRDDRVNMWFNGPDPNAPKVNISGIYHLSFAGTARLVSPNNIFAVRDQTYDPVTNITTADLSVTQVGDNAIFQLYFAQTANRASATGAGVTDIRLIRPGYSADTTQVFTTPLLEGLKGFDTIRVVDATGTNSFAPVKDASGRLVPLEWSQRRLPTASSQVDYYRGQTAQAWEYLVQLANTTGENLWVNIPGPASDDYIRQLALLLKNGSTVDGVTYPGLNPGLKIYLEYSNEVWGGMPIPSAYGVEATRQDIASGQTAINNDGLTDLYALTLRRQMQRTMRISQIFRDVYGPDPGHEIIRPVVEWQAGMSSLVRDTLNWYSSLYGPPSDHLYGIGAANYFFPTNYSSVDALLDSLRSGVAEATVSIKSYELLSNFYGLKNIAYEGGPAIGGLAGTPQATVALAASRDPRLTEIIGEYYSAFYASGIDLSNFYRGVYGTWTPAEQWPAVELGQVDDLTSSPKFRALRQIQAAAPVTPSVGRPVGVTAPVDLPVTQDDLGTWNASFPNTGQTGVWLLNVQQAGDYRLTLQTTIMNGAVEPGVIQVLLNDRTVLGTYTVTPYADIDLGKLTLPAGVVTLGLRAVRGSNDPSKPGNPSYYAFRMNTLKIASASYTPPVSTKFELLDPGFESTSSGATGYSYRPSGSPWTFVGTAGIALGASPFTGLTPAPAGKQVAFLQDRGTISQAVGAWPAGNYTISFSAAKRSYGGNQDFRVLVDGVEVGRFRPDSTSYKAYSTASFAVAGGLHTITFEGLNTLGIDASSLIDSVSVDAAAGTPPPTTPPPGGTTPTPGDASFEAASAGVVGFAYNPAGSAWTFAGSAGLSASGSALSAGSAPPSGSQAAFLQNRGSFSQSVAGWAAGNYTITFAAAKRSYAGNQDFRVLVDGVEVGRFRPDSTSYKAYATASFAVAAGSHTITFEGLNSSGGDNSALIDSVSVAPAAAGTPPPTTPPPGGTTPTPGDASFEAASAGVVGFAYNPAGSAWTFAGSAGLSASGSALSAGSAPPSGSQAAFLQNRGSFSQSVAGWAAGNYTITFAAAKRSHLGNQDFRVLVDGVEVGRFRPDSTAYKAYSTASFAVAAGSHTITFEGLNSSGGDNSALIDSIAIAAAAVPSPSDGGFEATWAGVVGFAYNPAGSAWAFAGSAGLSASGSALSAGSAPPSGSQAAFLQNRGSFSQSVAGWAAGNYTITFAAAKRSHLGNQDFRVLVDGVEVGRFRPDSTAYKAYATASFAVGAGSHTITFEGLNSAGGDNSSLIDSIAIAPAS